MEILNYWINEIALFTGGVIYAYSNERKENFWKKCILFAAGYTGIAYAVNLLPMAEEIGLRMLARILCFGVLILFQHTCWQMSWSAAVYYSIWATMSWQLLYEICHGIRTFGGVLAQNGIEEAILYIIVFVAGYLIVAFTIAKWMPLGSPKRIGPRQLTSAILIFCVFVMITLNAGIMEVELDKWRNIYSSQLLLAMLLYLQNELFKKSAMRQELEVMNLLWKKEQEQYQLSKENIALIHQKCHDLKHQIRAIRNCSKEEIDRYLEEMAGSIRIYEAIVKTGNEVLDTILTEKSLYCEERGITVSCVADGSQMDFINTVDLYAILGNALDNAIEAVEKFKHQEKRQIDVLIYRQQSFLVINIINPMKENLVYKEELPISTKGDDKYHGFGLRSIQYLVKKYDGYLNISEEDGCFSLKILMPIPSGKTL